MAPGLHARAREAAYDDARAKAAQYARLSGHELGRLVSLSEDAAACRRPAPSAGDASGAGLSAVPVASGEIRAAATVTAVYELD
ncbi:SIMPL domain-containing protein [Streptomyces sp. NPDC020951]|uniref:SIMPL domain-containing protein n=1 Tax=Streptomyces sp. NPDC020951 TaxID=3365104 RepID=UPI0037AC50E8